MGKKKHTICKDYSSTFKNSQSANVRSTKQKHFSTRRSRPFGESVSICFLAPWSPINANIYYHQHFTRNPLSCGLSFQFQVTSCIWHHISSYFLSLFVHEMDLIFN